MNLCLSEGFPLVSAGLLKLAPPLECIDHSSEDNAASYCTCTNTTNVISLSSRVFKMCQERLTNYDANYMNNDDIREVIRTISVARPGADDRAAAAEQDDILA